MERPADGAGLPCPLAARLMGWSRIRGSRARGAAARAAARPMDGVLVELPLCPLATWLYPGAPIPLHVFEERYRMMFSRILDAEGAERRFGVIAIVEGGDAATGSSLRAIGCVAEVRQVRPYPDGRL